MRTLLVSIFLILVSTFAFGQHSEVVGKWKGEWSNHEGFYFTFVLNLEEDKMGELSGEFIWKLIKSPRSDEQPKLGLTAIEYVLGTYDKQNRKLKLKGFKKEDPNLIIGIDTYDLKLSENGDVLEGMTRNHGSWKGVFYGIRQIEKEDKLDSKIELEGRKIITTQELSIQDDDIRLLFWDDNQEDGDIISLNLNGEWLLKNYVVKKSKGEIVLELIQGANYLILHAENLGEMAPNTAAVSIVENGKVISTLVLNSDMGKSEAIKIVKE